MSPHRDDPIEISKRSRFTMPLAMIGTLMVATYAIAMTYSSLKEADAHMQDVSQQHAVLLADHEQRIRHLESIDASLDEIKRMLAVRRESSSKLAQP